MGEAAIILVLVGLFVVWAFCASQKCAGCGHNEEDHVCGPDGEECMLCECKGFK